MTDTPGVLATARTEYAALLGDDVKDHAPAKLGPGGFVIPGDPWLERGDTVGSFRVRLEGVLIRRAVNNETSSSVLNAAIENVVVAIENDSEWSVRAVSAPYSISNDGDTVKYLAVQITSTKPIRL